MVAIFSLWFKVIIHPKAWSSRAFFTSFYRVKQPELFCPDRFTRDVWFTFGCIWVNSCWNRNVFSVLVAYDIVSAGNDTAVLNCSNFRIGNTRLYRHGYLKVCFFYRVPFFNEMAPKYSIPICLVDWWACAVLYMSDLILFSSFCHGFHGWLTRYCFSCPTYYDWPTLFIFFFGNVFFLLCLALSKLHLAQQ